MKRIIISMTLATIGLGVIAQVNPTSAEETNMKTLATVQDTGWAVSGLVNIGATGTMFSQWASGGINSFGVNGLFNGQANYRRGKNAWDNNLVIGYGLLKQGFESEIPWVKTDDRFDLTSKYGRPLNAKWNYAALFNINSQFSPGFATGGDGRPNRASKISDFLAPARLLFAIGLDHKPTSNISVFVSPITYRSIYVGNQNLANAGAFGVEKAVYSTEGILITPGENLRSEMGAYLRVNHNQKFLSEKLNWTNKLELFSNYLDKPQNIDINFESIAAYKVTKNIGISLSLQLIYDDNTQLNKADLTNDDGTLRANIGPGLQSKYVMNIGFVRTF
jgi:Protein of unknown function (DUF3078)